MNHGNLTNESAESRLPQIAKIHCYFFTNNYKCYTGTLQKKHTAYSVTETYFEHQAKQESLLAVFETQVPIPVAAC